MICIRDRVRFVETDTMGVVHHSKYLHWFEMGRAALLRAAGLSLNDLMDAGILFPIAEVMNSSSVVHFELHHDHVWVCS